MTRFSVLVGATLAAWCTLAAAADIGAERSSVEQWRAARVAELTSDQGWLTLVGLFWLEPGENTFGRAPSNRIALDHPALAPVAGSFFLDSHGVRFVARPASGVTEDGRAVAAADMVPDTQSGPTILASGSLQFFIIARSGKLGVRVRDVDSARRRHFAPIEYYPIERGWVFDARFEPYEPHRHIRIVNILGLEQDMESPGAIVFGKDGRDWRLDTLLEAPGDQTLFVMFADGTSGKETYGGGRFLRVPLPARAADGSPEQTTRVDFNQAYNPPCAFNDFATCPLPPYQNHLALRIESGEKIYGNGHGAPPH
ncbi:MAG: DUF1684 domain-containing protein [Steroidobacteraceae bacterium]